MRQLSFVSIVLLIVGAACSAEPGGPTTETQSQAVAFELEDTASQAEEVELGAVDSPLLIDPDNGGGKGTCKHVCNRACINSCKESGGSAAECHGDCCDEVCK